MESADTYHALAKDAGNRLRGYILGYASGATGVFFLALADTKAIFSFWQKTCLISAIIFFVITIVFCLYALHIDARRFFNIAKQLELPESERSWGSNERYKKHRVWLIYARYITVTFATIASVLFLIARIT